MIAGMSAIGLAVLSPAASAQFDDVSPLFEVDPIFQDGLIGFRTLSDRRFSLKRRGNETLFRFEGQNEVWALRSVPGPRGDEFLKIDTGRVFIRLTDLGGVILYGAEHPQGEPADPVEAALPINDPVREDGFQESLTTYLSFRIGKPVSLLIQSKEDNKMAWYQDAARITAEGMVRAQKESVEAVEEVLIRRGPKPDLELKDGRLTVFINPDKGYAGRPSSDRVILFLKNWLTS